jgi:hypothetical protein
LMSAQPPASWENWPTAGGTRNGCMFQRPTWAQVMGGRGGFAGLGAKWDTPDAMPEAPNTGSNRKSQVAGLGNQARLVASGLWTTPDVCSGTRDMSKIDQALQKRADTKRTTGLPTEAATWATPDCNTSTRSNGLMGPNIREQASQLATPNAHDGRRPGADLASTQGANLSRDAAQWPTPSASLANDGETPETWHARAATLKAKHGNGNGAGLPLTVATVQWPTPAARDYRSEQGGGQLCDGSHEPDTRPDLELHGRPFFAPGPADARWPAILQRWPWLAPAVSKEAEPGICGVADGLAVELDINRTQRLRCVGNGVVAASAAAAFVLLVRRAMT